MGHALCQVLPSFQIHLSEVVCQSKFVVQATKSNLGSFKSIGKLPGFPGSLENPFWGSTGRTPRKIIPLLYLDEAAPAGRKVASAPCLVDTPNPWHWTPPGALPFLLLLLPREVSPSAIIPVRSSFWPVIVGQVAAVQMQGRLREQAVSIGLWKQSLNIGRSVHMPDNQKEWPVTTLNISPFIIPIFLDWEH